MSVAFRLPAPFFEVLVVLNVQLLDDRWPHRNASLFVGSFCRALRLSVSH